MLINVKDVIKLKDDNEYVVISKVNYENRNYYYMIDINNNQNLLYCYEENGKFIEINNHQLLKRLIPLFLKNALTDFGN